jgi:hypothetical protein
MSYDPDFLLIVNGADVTRSLMNWHLALSDKESCSLTFSVENQNSEYAGLFQINGQVIFCFGYADNIQPSITLDILSIAPEFNTGTKSIKVTAYDQLHKLCNGSMKGCFKKGTKTDQAIKDTITACTTCTPNVNLTSPNFEPNHRSASPGWNPIQNIYYNANMSQASEDAGISSSYYPDVPGAPSSFSGTFENGWRTPATSWKARTDSRNPDSTTQNKDNTIDQNRNKNMNKNRNSRTVTAKLSLRGYPDLRPSACLTILNVDEYSGVWYCNHVDHLWANGNNQYLTHAGLMCGEVGNTGGSGSNAPNPMIVSCDPFKNQIYVGPRQTNAASQATFTYGVGEEVISFHPHITTEKKGASQGVGSSGKLIDAAGKSSDQYFEGRNRMANQ